MSEIQSLFDQLQAFKLAPIESWHPEKCVEIDIRIDNTGIWHYQGSPITRQRISKLFSTVLRLEDKMYFLVTPPVKYEITVDDAPFVAVELNRQGEGEGQDLYFRTNMDEVVLAGKEHPIFIISNENTGEPFPYIEIRNGLNAKLTRSVFYQLTDLVDTTDHPIDKIQNPNQEYYVYSNGVRFNLA